MANATTERERQRRKQAETRTAERDITIPKIANRQRRLDLEADDCRWLRHYFPQVFFSPFSPDQRQAVSEIRRAILFGTKKCIAGPRGDCKTSVSRYVLLKYMLQRDPKTKIPECPFGLYVGASDPKATESEAAIKTKLRDGCFERNREFFAHTPLGEDYPFECAISNYIAKAPSRANNVTTNGGWKIHAQWAGDQLILPSLEAGDVDDDEAWGRWMIKPGQLGAILVICGITSSLLQGSNVRDIRPRAVILDDLDKRSSLAVKGNQTTVEDGGKEAGKISEIINKTISGMKGQGQPMGQVMLCTVTTRRSVAFRYSDPEQEPSWAGTRNKRIKKWPKRLDLWDRYIELRQKGMREKDDKGETIDPHGRKAHSFLLANFWAMHEDAELGNETIHDTTILEDGTQAEVSTLQTCFNFIADEGEEAFKTEYQQEPPDEFGVDKLILTAYHVQHSARSGLPQAVVPADTAGIVCGLDVKKLGFHFVVGAYSETPTRMAIIEYNFHEIKSASGGQLRVEDAERAILTGLHEWKEARDSVPYLDADGRECLINLSLIDQGWKHESWAIQPVNHFCGEAGLNRFLPCKGWGDGQYRKPDATNRKIIIGDNCHVSFSGDVPHVNMNSDHWKMKVHEGFLTKRGEPGSIVLFEPSATKIGRRQQPHMSFAKHITAEVWEERFIPGYRGLVCKWWKDGANNHYFDASYQMLVARSLLGANTIDDSAAGDSQPLEAMSQQGNAVTVPAYDSGPEFSIRERSW